MINPINIKKEIQVKCNKVLRRILNHKCLLIQDRTMIQYVHLKKNPIKNRKHTINNK